jgi:hypothetical protein
VVVRRALEDVWLPGRTLRDRVPGPALSGILRDYERVRAPGAGLAAREAGKEVINNYRPLLIRLIPDSSASRYFTRFRGQVSNYLGQQPT